MAINTVIKRISIGRSLKAAARGLLLRRVTVALVGRSWATVRQGPGVRVRHGGQPVCAMRPELGGVPAAAVGLVRQPLTRHSDFHAVMVGHHYRHDHDQNTGQPLEVIMTVAVDLPT